MNSIKSKQKINPIRKEVNVVLIGKKVYKMVKWLNSLFIIVIKFYFTINKIGF